MKRYSKSEIMKAAWEIRKANKCGMGDALRAAWKIAKLPTPKAPELTGSEKQVKWALDIIASARAAIKSGLALAVKAFPEEVDLWEMMSKTYEAHIATITRAAVIIDGRKGLDGKAINYKMGQLRVMRSNGVKITA